MREVTGLSILALTLSLVQAQEPPTNTPVDLALLGRVLTLLKIGGQGTTEEEILARLTKPIRQYDRNGDGLQAVDAASQARIDSAALRAANVAPLLQFDLDGDQTVTRAELEEVIAYPSVFSGNPRGSKELFDSRDRDKNGTVTWEEMIGLDEGLANRAEEAGIGQFLEAVAIFSPGYRTRFTLDDARTLAPLIMSKLDMDGNGIATVTETQQLFFAASSSASDQVAAPTCVVPKVEAGAEILLIGAYEGKRYASVNFGDITEDTGFADVRVEDGHTPLYIVLSAYSSVVWNFSGDTARVGKVVVSGYNSSGVVGIDASKVAFLKADTCITPAYDFESFDGIRTKGEVDRLLGQKAKASGTYALGTIAIPSMQFDEPTTNSRRERLAVTVDPETVVSNSKVARFEVLPGQAGINQLLDNGSLVAVERGYRIVKPIAHYPAGLHGAHSTKFILGKSIPEPGGDPGHSCVISEEDGLVIAGSALC